MQCSLRKHKSASRRKDELRMALKGSLETEKPGFNSWLLTHERFPWASIFISLKSGWLADVQYFSQCLQSVGTYIKKKRYVDKSVLSSILWCHFKNPMHP